MNQHPAPAPRRGTWIWATVLAALWLPLCWRLYPAWNASAELAHGWAVPVFAAWLAWQRLQNPPASALPERAAQTGPSTSRCRALDGGAAASILAWIALPPAMIALVASLPVLEANPQWPAAQWLGTTGAIVATLALIQLAAGRTAWTTHLAFPVLFMLTALDWPAAARQPLLSALSVFNAQLAAEVTSLAGHPAVAEGSVIAVSGGYVGVDEACAGLRSLQAVWMFSWFFGELHRLRLVPRLGLVAVALLAAFAGNLARTLFLTWQIAAHGAEAGHHWHDRAGLIVLIATLVVLVAFSQWLASRAAKHPHPGGVSSAPIPAPPSAPPAPTPAASPATPAVHTARAATLAALPTGLAASVVALVLAAEGGTQAWFARHAARAGGAQWQLRTDTPHWTRLEIPSRVHDLLGFTSGEYLLREGLPRGGAAVAYALRWEGDVAAGEVTELHDPTICMPAIGARLEHGPEQVRVVEPYSGREIVFDAWRFSTAGATQHVFFCVWDAFHGRPRTRDPATVGARSWSPPRFRLERVAEGRRRADLAQVIFVLQGEATDAEARAWLQTAVSELLREKH
ncbi:exosortase/archaeosortase family protein [Geminisphaera colitermitum]|uniref:exosortase/archaeosortase family protein n=1 Tax=Geminisphaera colitermitum TaxID=1148786 RepID=UPI00019654FC|nr:exosortase/archaeosortase family protein [Geminisphaera colitermitum]